MRSTTKAMAALATVAIMLFALVPVTESDAAGIEITEAKYIDDGVDYFVQVILSDNIPTNVGYTLLIDSAFAGAGVAKSPKSKVSVQLTAPLSDGIYDIELQTGVGNATAKLVVGEVPKYEVSFALDTGSGYMDPVMVPLGWYDLPPCEFIPPSSAMEFGGWMTLESSGKTFEKYYVTENVTFYPKWVEKVEKFEVAFDANDGSGTMDPVMVPAGEYTLPACTFEPPTGKEFAGWSLTSDGSVITKVDVSENTKVYATWKESVQKFEVSFDANDGSGTMDPVMVPAGEFTLPECEFGAPAGKEFAGWSLTADGSVITKVDVSENTKVYATWKDAVSKFEVAFDANGGSGTMDPKMVPAGEYTLPACTFTPPSGKEFAGWSLTSDGSVITKVDVSENTKVYATWKDAVSKFEVAFDANGGSGTMDPEMVPAGEYTLPECEFTFEGMKFVGWSETRDGAIVEKIDVTENVTVYAIWEVQTFELTFIVEGFGAVDTSTLTVPYGSVITLVGNVLVVDGNKVTATPDGSDDEYTYSFVEWSVLDGTAVKENLEVKAIFDQMVNKYTVKWMVDGAVHDSYTVDYGSDLVIPDTPTKASTDPRYSYEFKEWSGYVEGMTVESDLEFTAVFETIVNTVELTFVAGDYGTVDTASLVVPYGSVIAVVGSTVLVDGEKVMAIPMTSDAQYTYSFVEWSVSDGDVADADMDVEATFDRAVNKYAVKWFVDGELYDSEMVDFGSLPTVPESPTKTSTDPAVEYKFAGWYGYALGMIVEKDLDFTAMFDTVTNMVELTFSAGEHGSVDTASLEVPYGSKISVAGNAIVVDGKKVMAIPMTSDAQYTYSFVEWSVSDGTVADKNLEAKATFSRVVNQYTVMWFVDGEIYYYEMVEYGSDPTVPEEPTRTYDPRYTYEFTGWSGYSSGDKITGDTTITGGINTTKNYSEEVQVSVRTSAEGVTVLIRAADGKIVPEGSYSVSYSITYYSAALKMYVTKTVNMDSVDLENDDEASSITKDQKLTDQPNYSKITKAWAYYKSVDGSSDDRSDMIVYTPAKTA